MLTERLREAQAYVEKQGYTLAYAAIYGSQNYGLSLDTPEYRSDVDIKCAVLPSLSLLAREETVPSQVLDVAGGQIEVKDARRFVQVAMRQNPSYLETLMTPHYLAPCAAFEQVRALVPALLESDPAGFLKACRGMGMEKRKNLCHPYPAAMEKIQRWAYDGKQAHHMYRLLLIMRRFALDGQYVLQAPQEEYDFLIALKRNDIPLARALEYTQAWAQEMDEICQSIREHKGAAARIEKQAKELVFEAIEAHIRCQCI